MKRSPGQFKEAILDVLQELRWNVPTFLETYNREHLNRDGARVYALEHCVFAANFPRWLTNVTGNCPHLEVRQYLIENAFVEEVRDPTIVTGHYESMVDFAVALGLNRNYIYTYQGAPITKMRITFSDRVETPVAIAVQRRGPRGDSPIALLPEISFVVAPDATGPAFEPEFAAI